MVTTGKVPNTIPICQECGKEIICANRKNQKFCRVVDSNCVKNVGNRNYLRRKNKTKTKNFRGKYLKK